MVHGFGSPQTPSSFFISFEGIEGCGKSTQIRRLESWLNEQAYRVLLVREPGGTAFGEKLREAILQSTTPLHPVAEAMLFASSRAQLLSERILPHLHHTRSVVMADRYIDSSLAYQGEAGGLGIDTILDLHRHHPLCLLPHLSFYLRISKECSFRRQEARGKSRDYFESRPSDFYDRLIRGYDEAAKRFPERIVILNGDQDENTVAEDILARMTALMGGRDVLR